MLLDSMPFQDPLSSPECHLFLVVSVRQGLLGTSVYSHMADNACFPVLRRTCQGPELQAPESRLCRSLKASVVMETAAISKDCVFFLWSLLLHSFLKFCFFSRMCSCGVLIYPDVLRVSFFNLWTQCWETATILWTFPF